MQLTEIRKVSLSASEDNGALVSLALSAKEILGYDVFAKSVAVLTELTPLQAALQSAEIEVLRNDDVAKYQKEQMIEHTAALMKNWLKETAAMAEVKSFNRFSGPAWVQTKISEYSQPIPEFVLAKAVQIKQAIPDCEIYVESLEDHPDPFLVVAIPDGRPYYPAKERHYVEVWAEPKFEGRLIDTDIF